MIPQIKEINFPDYATLHKASASFSDMGDRVITAEVKIDGAKRPSFVGREGTDAHGDDWEIELLGERYIQPLREPQAKKDNTSLYSTISLTFYHWAIYQLKRYFFVALANVESGTAIVDSYIAPIAVNLPEFAKAFDDMLAYYFPDRSIYVYKTGESYINPELTDYDNETKYIEVDHTYLWEVLQRTYELFNCRWTIEKDEEGKYAIKFGYPVNTELSHIFQYGYEGGLLSVERQVQDDDIRNQLLGRGGEKNMPYMYFKDYEKFHPNSDDSAYTNYGLPDPDAIPELENILFTNLRDSNFRSYVQGWKVNRNRKQSTEDGWYVDHNEDYTDWTESDGTSYSLDTARLETDWAYAKGATDVRFNPVEYVKDDESIATFGLLQGGLEDNEDAYPTIHDMEIELPCIDGVHDGFSEQHNVFTLADEVVAVEDVITDEIKDIGEAAKDWQKFEIKSNSITREVKTNSKTPTVSGLAVSFAGLGRVELTSEPFDVGEDYWGNIIFPPVLSCLTSFRLTANVVSNGVNLGTQPANLLAYVAMNSEMISWGVYEYGTDQKLKASTNLPTGRYYVKALYDIKDTEANFPTETLNNGRIVNRPNGITGNIEANLFITAICDLYSFEGELVPNTTGTTPISETHTIPASESYTFNLVGSRFHVPAQGALVVECPVYITPDAQVGREITTKIINVNSGQVIVNSNIPEGDYEIRVEAKVHNLSSDETRDFTVSLGPAFVYYITNNEEWKPTFDIWIKNVFNSNRNAYGSDDDYMRAIWEPLISTQEMTVTFTTGNLSRHSDWEFTVKKDGIAYDNSKTLVVKDEDGVEHTVRSEWRLTLIKSDAEADSIHKYVPYKDFNAAPYDRFIFSNIYLPWAYVYAAERFLHIAKENALEKTKNIQPTWVVNADKIRFSELGLLWDIRIGDKLWVRDSRFTPEVGVQLYVQSLTYNWEGDGALIPDIEFVLSDKVETALSSVARIQGDIKQLSTQVRSLSDIERSIRKVGDAVYLRKDGFEDTTYSPTIVARTLSSQNYRPGIVGGAGWSHFTDANGDSILEVDKVNVRKELHVNNLVANQVTAMGGKEIQSAANMEISRVESTEAGYVCYFEQHNGTIGNLFKVNDVAMSQVFDPNNLETKYYKRRVIAVGPDYITLSYTDVNGEGAPAVGDIVAQYGNYTDSNRQFVIVRDVIGGGYEQMLYGLDSVDSNGEEYYFAGAKYGSEEFVNLSEKTGALLQDKNGLFLGFGRPKIAPRWFVGDHNGEYAEWQDGELTVKGRIVVRNSDGQYKDMSGYIDTIDYLNEAMPEDADNVTTIDGGIVLSKIIGVVSNSDLVAGVNATDLGQDQSHGILMIFAGANGAQNVSSSNFRVFADGTVYTNRLIAQSGCDIGDFHLDSNIVPGHTVMYGSKTLSESLGISASCSFYVTSIIFGANTNTQISNITIDANPNNRLLSIINSASAADLGIGGHGSSVGAFIQMNGANMDHRGLWIRSVGNSVQNKGIQIEASGTDATNYGVDISASGTGTNYGINVSASGGTTNYAIRCTNGLFAGLRPRTRFLNSGDTLSVDDFNVFVNNTQAATLTLPSNPQVGQTYHIIKTGGGMLSIDCNGSTLWRNGSTYSGVINLTSLNVIIVMFCYGSQNWVATLHVED